MYRECTGSSVVTPIPTLPTLLPPQKYAFHITFRPETLPDEDYKLYLANLQSFLVGTKADKWYTGREVKVGMGGDVPTTGLHFHTAVYYCDGRDTSNISKSWRQKLLKGLKVRYEEVALDIRHEYPFINYLGYAAKDGVCESSFNVSEEDLVNGRKQLAIKESTDRARIMGQCTYMISNGRLKLYRAWARFSGAQDGEEDDWLALRGYYSAQAEWDPSENAMETFLSNLPKY